MAFGIYKMYTQRTQRIKKPALRMAFVKTKEHMLFPLYLAEKEIVAWAKGHMNETDPAPVSLRG